MKTQNYNKKFLPFSLAFIVRLSNWEIAYFAYCIGKELFLNLMQLLLLMVAHNDFQHLIPFSYNIINSMITTLIYQ